MVEKSDAVLISLAVIAVLGLVFYQVDISGLEDLGKANSDGEDPYSQNQTGSEALQASTDYTDTFEGELGSEYVFDIETVSVERQGSRNGRLYYRSELDFELTDFGEKVLEASSDEEVRDLVRERFVDYPEREGFEEDLIRDVEAVNEKRIGDIPVEALTGRLESLEDSEEADAEIVVSFEKGSEPEIKWGSFSTVWTLNSGPDHTQFYTDLSKYSAGQKLRNTSDWSLVAGNNELNIVDDQSYSGGKKITPKNLSTIGVKYDAFASANDSEIALSGISTTQGGIPGPGLRLKEQSGSVAGYFAANEYDGFAPGNFNRIWEVSGFPNKLGESGATAPDTLKWLRFRVNGSDLKLKVWSVGSSEPSNWDVEVTDSTHSAGATGIFHQLSVNYSEIGIGIEGDPAPTGFPEVSTNQSFSIGTDSVSLNGSLQALNNWTDVDAFFRYRKTGESTWQKTSNQTLTSLGDFNQTVTGLQSGTQYEFKSVAGFNGEVNGTVKTFTTNSGPSLGSILKTDSNAVIQTNNGVIQTTS